MPKNRYVSIDFVSRSGVRPGFEIDLPAGVLDRAKSAYPDLEASIQELTQAGLTELKLADRPKSDNPSELELDLAQATDHLTLWPGRLRRLDAVSRDERHFTAMTLNEVTGALIADAPYVAEQPHALRMRAFQSDGTPDGFMIEADIMLPKAATGPMLRRQAVTAMAEVSIAYGLQLDSGNKPSAVVDIMPGEILDTQPEVSLSPSPFASLNGEKLPHAPNVWHMTSQGLNNHEHPLVVLAGLVAMTSLPTNTDGGNDLSKLTF